MLASVVAMCLNLRRTSAVASGGVVLALCIVIGVLYLVRGLPIPASQALQLWLVFVSLPCAAVWGLSRVELLIIRPWLIVLVGPIAYGVAVVVSATTFSILFPMLN